MGSRYPSHRLGNGLVVSGRLEQPKEKAPTMSSSAMPYTGGDIKKSGELGKMFIPTEGSKSRKSGPITGPPSRTGSFAGAASHSGSMMSNAASRAGYTTSGPLSSGGLPGSASLKKSSSGPLNKHGEPIKKSSGPQSCGVTRQNSGSIPSALPATGLITSGPISSGPLNSSGAPRKVSGPLESTGSMKLNSSSISNNPAVTTLSQDDDYSVRRNFPKTVVWLVILIFVMGLLAGGFILGAVHNAILLVVVVVLFVIVAALVVWNMCGGRRYIVEFTARYPDADLRTAKNGQYVKVSGVVTCGNVPLESSFQRVPRCVYTSTRLYEYRAWGSKPANPSHRHFTWGLRSSERHVVDFYISDFQSGLRALVKTGNGTRITPFVDDSLVVDINPEKKDLSPEFVRWLGKKNLSGDERLMRLKEGYIKEGSTVSVMGTVQRNDNVLMIVAPPEPLATGWQWSRCIFPASLDGIVLRCEDTSNDDVIPVEKQTIDQKPGRDHPPVVADPSGERREKKQKISRKMMTCTEMGSQSRHVVDFYISDFQSGLRALVKTGNGTRITPFVDDSLVFIAPLSKYIKEGSTVSVMGTVQRNDNVLMIVAPPEPLATGWQWSRCIFPASLDGIVLRCEDTSNDDVIPVEKQTIDQKPGRDHPPVVADPSGERKREKTEISRKMMTCTEMGSQSFMGSRYPSHRLGNGLVVSGRLEQPKEKAPTMSSSAMPYTGGDIKKSGELGKMFIPTEGSKSRKSGPITGPPSRTGSFAGAASHSGSMVSNAAPRAGYTTSGPLPSGGLPGSASLKKSSSGPLNKHGEPIKKSSGPQSGGVTRQNSGSIPSALPATGLITSGPISSGPLNSSGAPRKVSGPLESTGSMKLNSSSISNNPAVTTLSQDDDYSVRRNFPKTVVWLVILILVMGLLAGGFILGAVHNAILLVVVAALFVVVAALVVWNMCRGSRSIIEFIGRYPDTDLRTAKNGQYVKVSGVVTCGNVPLESSFQRIPRCVYTSTRLYEYRTWGSKPANPNHRHFTWGLRSSETHVVDFYISDFQSGLRALIKTGSGTRVAPFVDDSFVVDINPGNKDLSPEFVRWLGKRNLSSDERLMRLKEGYIKEGSTVSVMGIVQRNENVLMIVPPPEPLATGWQWPRCIFPASLDGIVLRHEDTSDVDVIPV
ncbi:hypothetical protein POTOM_037122 [Populus tomentosa]|nr:hypothetical protein POTOM_037122 [Populus tomentosa]